MREGAGIGLAIGIAAVAFFATLPFVIVVLFWLFTSGVAFARSNDPAATSAPALLIGLASIVLLLTTGLAATFALIGRSLTPPGKKRREKAEKAEAARASTAS
ncbi:MAG: hypothetical protein WD206_09880 [Actinomycetota bacterium]